MQPSSGMFVSEVQGLLMAMSDAKGKSGSTGSGPSMERSTTSSASRPSSRGGTHHVPSLPVPAAPPGRLPASDQYGKAPPPSYTRVKMSDIIMSDYRVSPDKASRSTGPMTEAYLAQHASGRAAATRAAQQLSEHERSWGASPGISPTEQQALQGPYPPQPEAALPSRAQAVSQVQAARAAQEQVAYQQAAYEQAQANEAAVQAALASQAQAAPTRQPLQQQQPRNMENLTWEQLLPHAAATFQQTSKRAGIPSPPQPPQQQQQQQQRLDPKSYASAEHIMAMNATGAHDPSSFSSEISGSQHESTGQPLDSQGQPLPPGNSSRRVVGGNAPSQPPPPTTAGQRLSELDRLSADAALRARHETAKSLPIAANNLGGGGNGTTTGSGGGSQAYHHPPTTPMAGAANGGGRSTVGAALERRRNAAAAAAAAASATDNASSSSSSNSAGAISPYNNNGSSSSNTSEALKDAQKAFQWLSARTSFAGKGLDHSSGQGAGTVQLMAPGTRQMPLWATSTLSLLKSIYPEVLRAGDSVVWAPEGTSVSEGAAAEFVEYKLRGEMAKLSFGDGGIDEVRISEVTKPKVNFATNDRVTWSNFDDGVPRGSIGEVVGYNERGRVRVRFPKGTWNFLPAELRKEADKGITPGAIAIVDACASELLGRFFTAASLCAAPAAPGVRAFQSAVQLCLPSNSSSSSSTAQDQGESTASSSSLAMKALAGFDAAVRRLRDAKKEGSLNFINSSSDGNNSRGGAGGGQSLADRAGVCLDPHIIIRAAASHGLGCDRVGVASSDWPQALLSANSNNSPSSASSGSSGAIGESEAVGLAGALEVVLGLLLTKAGATARHEDPRGGGVIAPKHLDAAILGAKVCAHSPGSTGRSQAVHEALISGRDPSEGLLAIFPGGATLLGDASVASLGDLPVLPVSPNSNRSSPNGKHPPSSSTHKANANNNSGKGGAQQHSKTGGATSAAASTSSDKSVEAMLVAAGGDTNELISLVLAHLNDRYEDSKAVKDYSSLKLLKQHTAKVEATAAQLDATRRNLTTAEEQEDFDLCEVLAEQVSAFEAQITEHAKAANQITASSSATSAANADGRPSSSSSAGGTSPSAPPPPPPPLAQAGGGSKQRPRSPSPPTAPPPLAPGSATAAANAGTRFRNTAGKEIAAYDPTAAIVGDSAGGGSERMSGGGDLTAEFEVAKVTKDYARLRFIKEAISEQAQATFQLDSMKRALAAAEEAEDYERCEVLSAKLISAEERAAATEQQVRSDLARMPPPSLPNGGSFSSASDLRTFGSATVNPSDDVGVQAMQALEAQFEATKKAPSKDYAALKLLKQQMALQESLNHAVHNARQALAAAEASEDFGLCEKCAMQLHQLPKTYADVDASSALVTSTGGASGGGSNSGNYRVGRYDSETSSAQGSALGGGSTSNGPYSQVMLGDRRRNSANMTSSSTVTGGGGSGGASGGVNNAMMMMSGLKAPNSPGASSSRRGGNDGMDGGALETGGGDLGPPAGFEEALDAALVAVQTAPSRNDLRGRSEAGQQMLRRLHALVALVPLELLRVESLERQESLYKVGDRVVILGSRGVNGRPKGVVVTAEPDNGDGNYTIRLDQPGGRNRRGGAKSGPRPPLIGGNNGRRKGVGSMGFDSDNASDSGYGGESSAVSDVGYGHDDHSDSDAGGGGCDYELMQAHPSEMALLSTPMDEMVALVATATHVGHVAADAIAAAKQTLRDLMVRERAIAEESEAWAELDAEERRLTRKEASGRYGGTSLGRAGDWTSSGRKNPKIAARGRAPKSDSGLSYGDHNHRGNSSSAGMQPQQQRTRAERALSLVGGSAAAAASGGASSSRGGGVRGSSRTKMGNNSAANDDRYSDHGYGSAPSPPRQRSQTVGRAAPLPSSARYSNHSGRDTYDSGGESGARLPPRNSATVRRSASSSRELSSMSSSANARTPFQQHQMKLHEQGVRAASAAAAHHHPASPVRATAAGLPPGVLMAPLAGSGLRDNRGLDFDRDPRDFDEINRRDRRDRRSGNYDGRGSEDGDSGPPPRSRGGGRGSERGESGRSGSRGGGGGDNYRSFAADVSSGRRNRDNI